MLQSKPIGWITAGTLLCVAGVAVACRWTETPASVEATSEQTTAAFKAEYPVTAVPATAANAESKADKKSKKSDKVVVAGMDAEPVPPPVPEVNNANTVVPTGTANTPAVPGVLPPPAVAPVTPNAADTQAPTPPPSVPSLPSPPPLAPSTPAPATTLPPPLPELPKAPAMGTLPEVKKPEEKKADTEPVTPTGAVTPVAPVREPQTNLFQPVPTAVPSTPTPTSTSEPPVNKEPTTTPSVPVTPIEKTAKTELPAPTTTGPLPHTQQALVYQVKESDESFQTISRKTMNTVERWQEIERLNPALAGKKSLPVGTWVLVPPDARVDKLTPIVPVAAQVPADPMPEKKSSVQPVPMIRGNQPPTRTVKVTVPMTGTYPCKIEENRAVTVPPQVLQQIGQVNLLLLTPAPQKCLWVASQAEAERVMKRIEKAQIHDEDAEAFRRIYFAQSEKVTLDSTGRITLPAKLAEYAQLEKEVVIVGIDDHFELWDAARWERYSQNKSTIKKLSTRERSRTER